MTDEQRNSESESMGASQPGDSAPNFIVPTQPGDNSIIPGRVIYGPGALPEIIVPPHAAGDPQWSRFDTAGQQAIPQSTTPAPLTTCDPCPETDKCQTQETVGTESSISSQPSQVQSSQLNSSSSPEDISAASVNAVRSFGCCKTDEIVLSNALSAGIKAGFSDFEPIIANLAAVLGSMQSWFQDALNTCSNHIGECDSCIAGQCGNIMDKCAAIIGACDTKITQQINNMMGEAIARMAAAMPPQDLAQYGMPSQVNPADEFPVGTDGQQIPFPPRPPANVPPPQMLQPPRPPDAVRGMNLFDVEVNPGGVPIPLDRQGMVDIKQLNMTFPAGTGGNITIKVDCSATAKAVAEAVANAIANPPAPTPAQPRPQPPAKPGNCDVNQAVQVQVCPPDPILAKKDKPHQAPTHNCPVRFKSNFQYISGPTIYTQGLDCYFDLTGPESVVTENSGPREVLP